MLGDADCEQVRPLVGDSFVDLDSPEAPAPHVLADLLESTVRLVAPTDVPLDVVGILRVQQVPRTFQASGWLREHRALIFRDSHCHLGSLVVRYEPELGLSINETS